VRGTTLFILKCVEKVALSTAAPMPRIERISREKTAELDASARLDTAGLRLALPFIDPIASRVGGARRAGRRWAAARTRKRGR